MNAREIHQRAKSFILDQAVSEIEPEDAYWLAAHLEECATCCSYADTARNAILTLRGASEMPSPTLVRATQRSVRFAARNLGDAASQRRMLVVSCMLAAAWGAVLQPYLWRLFGLVGGYLGLPGPAWQAAFAAMWVLPGIVSVLLFMHMPLPSWIQRSLEKGMKR